MYGQRRQKNKQEKEKQEQQTDSVQTIGVTPTGIYEGTIPSDMTVFRVSEIDDIYMLPVSLPDSIEPPSSQNIGVGLGRGVLSSDYIPDPEDSTKAIAYVAIARNQENPNQAIRFVSFDATSVQKFEELAKEDKSGMLYLYGTSMDIEEASVIANVDLNPTGLDIPTYHLAISSRELVKNPCMVLVYGSLLRKNVDYELKDAYYASQGFVHKTLVSMIGYDEMKERSYIDKMLLPYLQTKQFLTARWFWPEAKEGVSEDSRGRQVVPNKDVSRETLNEWRRLME